MGLIATPPQITQISFSKHPWNLCNLWIRIYDPNFRTSKSAMEMSFWTASILIIRFFLMKTSSHCLEQFLHPHK